MKSTITKDTTKQLARALVDLRDRVVQKTRIQFENRLNAIDKGLDKSDYRYYIEKYYKLFLNMEKELDEALDELADDFPIVEYMTKVRGVGKTLALKVAVMVDIEKADTISALWRYAGFAVIDGRREMPRKGEKLHYNQRLKTTCYLIGTSFLRSRSPYREIYDRAKDYYQNNRPDWTRAHIHNAAMRKMIKIWLAHLWLVWRTMEGLPTTLPWIAGENGHHNIYSPEEFGWVSHSM